MGNGQVETVALMAKPNSRLLPGAGWSDMIER
jgi:hypothetical protein